MRYDAEHKERTRRRLLTEAADALRGDGPDKVGVAALMSKLGLTHGGFYAHFKSKDDLIAHAIDEMFAQTLTVLKKKTEGRPPAEALERYIDFYLSATHSDSMAQGCAVPAMAADVARMGPLARKKFAEGTERLHQGIANVFRAQGCDAETAMEHASSLFSELAVAVAIARAVASPKQAEQIRNRSKAAIKKRFGLLPAA